MPCSRPSTNPRDWDGHRRPGSSMAPQSLTHPHPLASARTHLILWPDGRKGERPGRRRSRPRAVVTWAVRHHVRQHQATVVHLAARQSPMAVRLATQPELAVSRTPKTAPLWPAALAAGLAPTVTRVSKNVKRSRFTVTRVSLTPSSHRHRVGGTRTIRSGENDIPRQEQLRAEPAHHRGTRSLRPPGQH